MVVTRVTTSSLKIICDLKTNLVSFYDVKSSADALLSETNKTFTAMTDSATKNATYSLLTEWNIGPSTRGLYGWGEYQNGFTNFIGSTVRCVPFNTEACVPMIVSNAAFGIYWDNLGVSTLNSLNTEAVPTEVAKGRGISHGARSYDDDTKYKEEPTVCNWFNLTIPFTASNVDGDRYFFSKFAEWNVFGAPKSGDAYLEFLVQREDGDLVMVDRFNYTNNIPSSLAMQPFYLRANEEVTLYLNYQCFNDPPTVFYREPSAFIDIEANEGYFMDYYFIYAPKDEYKSRSPVHQASLDGVIAGYRLLTQDGITMYTIFGVQ